MNEYEIIGLDGESRIIYTHSFNIYENKLIIPDFLNRRFIFLFENIEPRQDQKDVEVKWHENEAKITFSKKFRNSLGSGTTSKINILKTEGEENISFSVFGQQVGEQALNITINFYID